MDDVESDIRHEQMKKMWIRYGKYALGSITGILLATTGWNIYSNHCEANLLLTSEKFSKAQNMILGGATSKGVGVLETIKLSDSATYAALARITQAQTMTAKGGSDYKKAQDMLVALASDKKIDVVFRDFALLTFVKNEIDQLALPNEYLDTSIDETLKAKLLGYAVQLDTISSANAPWRLNAMDLKGLILFIVKDYQKASDTYVQIAQDEKCPQGLMARVDLMSQMITKKLK